MARLLRIVCGIGLVLLAVRFAVLGGYSFDAETDALPAAFFILAAVSALLGIWLARIR